MSYIKLPLILILFVIAGITGRALFIKSSTSYQEQQVKDNSSFPIASYEASGASDKEDKNKRKIKGKRYDNWKVVNKTTEQGGMEIFSEVEYPALPVLDSDAIVIGEIIEAQAHLSNDLGGVYSEFTTRVSQIFKQDSENTIAPDSIITAERPGGKVLFPSGKVAKYKYVGQGMPQQGRTYLLFLKRNQEADDYKIITGYELRSGKVSPIDGAISARGNKKWFVDIYAGTDQTKLLTDLQKEIDNPSQKKVVY
jgi:hypothetical protein